MSVTGNSATAVLDLIETANERGSLMLAIDGMSAAGKSTLATLVVEQLPDAELIRGDDFYRVMDNDERFTLSPEQGYRQDFDWQRLRREVLDPLRAAFVTGCLRLHLLRGAISAVAVTAAFASFTYLELATATTISFTAPFFVTLLGRIALGESVPNLRWACIAIGFVGVSLAARPGDAAGWAVGVAVIGALAVALAKLYVKKLASQDSPETVLVYLFTTMTAISVLPAAWLGHSLTAGSVVAMAAIGVLSFLAQGCVVLGYRTAKASAVASAEYARLPFAVVLGILFFDERPDFGSMIGAGLIIGAGAISSVFGDRNGRQRSRSRPNRSSPQTPSARSSRLPPLSRNARPAARTARGNATRSVMPFPSESATTGLPSFERVR